MRLGFVSCGFLLSFGALAHASPARAQVANDPVAAEALFQSAKELLQAGDWPSACMKFQASMDLDPSVSTLLKIARCREHEGKLATAAYDYQRALDMNRSTTASAPRKKELEEFAASALAAVLPRVPKLRILIESPPPGLRLTRNGQALPVAVLGEALPVDPGDQEIVADALGYRSEKRLVTLREGERLDVTLVLRAAATSSALPGPADGKIDGGAQRTFGLVLGGVGVVSLGVAAVFGVQTLVKVGDSSPYCNASNQCLQQGLDLRSDARTAQTLGFVFLGVGAAALVTGIAIHASAPAPPRVAFRLMPGGLLASGAW